MAEKLKVDLHTHTSHSKDGGQTPQRLVDAAISLGFDAIAVTDHNTAEGGFEAERYAMKKPIIVIPGQEVETLEGEIVVLGLKKTLPKKKGLEETVRAAKRKGGFIIVPHPFDIMRKGVGRGMDRILEYIDAVEAFNSRTMVTRLNRGAMEYAREKGKPMVACSDAHYPDEMGKTYMLIQSEKNTKSILSAVKAGRTEFIMKPQSRTSKLRRGFRKLGSYF